MAHFVVRSSAQLTADSGLPLRGGAQRALRWPPGTPGTPSQPPLPASSHSAAGAFSPEIYLCSCSKSGPEVLIFFFFALSISTNSCRSQQSREGLGASPCETPTCSCTWGWCFICLQGAEQRCIVSHVFLLHLWSMLIDIYRQGFASSPSRPA